MRHFKVFYLRVCCTFFMSAQFSYAGKIQISDPDNTFAYTATLHSWFVKEPNQDDFTQRVLATQTILGVHEDQITFSFYESGASYTFLTFKQKDVDVEIFHTTSITFSVKEKVGAWHFRCVFSADTSTIVTLHSSLSVCTGFGCTKYIMDISKVESYATMSHMRNPIIRTVTDLKPAMLYDQKIAADSTGKIFNITTYGSRLETERRRLVFRTGTFRVAIVNEKIALELAGFSDCLFILYFEDATQARTCLSHINGTNENEALDMTSDLRFYLEHGWRPTYQLYESGPQSSSQPDQDGARTLSSRKHPRCDQHSSRNVRTRSDDDRE